MKKEKNSPDTNAPPELNSSRRLLVFVLGIFIGLAVIVPGVSGSAIAMMLGLYTAMLYALGNIFSDFRRCVKFLIPLVLGAAVGFGAGFILIQKLFGKYLFEVVCLFVGFMIGALPAITREIKGAPITPTRGILFPVGLLIPIGIGIVSIILTRDSGTAAETFTRFPVWLFLLYFPLGFLVSLTQIVPGLSATAILMAFGQFGPILNSVSVSYILKNPEVLGLYASLMLGFLVGIVLISKLFSMVLVNHKLTAFFMISGMSVGSVISMFINPDVYDIYVLWGKGETSPTLTLIVGGVLLVVGFLLSFLLTRYEKHFSRSEK